MYNFKPFIHINSYNRLNKFCYNFQFKITSLNLFLHFKLGFKINLLDILTLLNFLTHCKVKYKNYLDFHTQVLTIYI